MSLPENCTRILESIELPEDIEDIIYVDDIPEEEQVVHGGRNYSKVIVSMVGYLVGVPQKFFGKDLLAAAYEDMEKNEDARIVRALCTIRNALLRFYGTIYKKMKTEIRNLDSIPEYIDPELFTFLESKKIRIISGSQVKDIYEYIITLNAQINNRLNQVMKLFPAWAETKFIRDIIAMPDGGKKGPISSASKKIQENLNSYPFGCYINWPIDRKDAFVENPEYHLDEVHTGNVLLNDKRFMTLLYRHHGAEFLELDRVTDANEETRGQIEDFLSDNKRIVMLVDCENSDPYKLCAALDAMREIRGRLMLQGENGSEAGFIEKIMLFDDSHTVDAWDIVSLHTQVPIEHHEIERVLPGKSLVDIAMTAGAGREHYKNGVEAFMIASSDSDYWGLIRSMPDVRFIVLAECEKLSPEAERHYIKNNVPVCMMDDFADNLSRIREGALYQGLEKRINNQLMLNLDDILADLYSDLRLNMSPRERDNFRSAVGKEIKVLVANSGEITVKVA